MAAKNNTTNQLRGMITQYLNILGLPTDKPFHCVNPNHEDRTPSMSFNSKDSQHVHCFGCHANWDLFDLIAVNELDAPVIDDANGEPKVQYRFSDAYNRAIQVLGVNVKPMAQSEHKKPENERESQLRAKRDEVNAFIVENASKLLSTSEFNQIKNPKPEQRQSHELGLKYLQERGLSPEIAERFKVGFSSNWTSPTAFLKGHKPQETPRLIIPTGPFSYIARDSRDSIPDNEQNYKKMKEGPVHIFNEEALSKNQPIFIVEGEIDAMSIMETGKAEAIGLGSVANINIFMKALYKAKKARKDDFYPTFLIALDNDDAGNRAINMLTTQLNHAGATNYVVQIARGSKDANEALVKDRAQFTKDIENTLKDPDNRLQGLLDYINRNEEVEAIPTGFSNLDQVLDGGLYEGLYGIGAISSLGKTTFVLQIADYIAQLDRKPVLYFALEMGTYELMTKSISRITFENAQGEETLAQGTRSLLKGKWKQRYNKAQYANVMQSFKEYGDFYSNVIIHDGSEARPTIYDISKTVNSYVARTGNKPVVIIDYLQILKPTNERGTDKANVTTSVNEMKKIATRYHIPVIVISSFNRLNYNSPVSMEAFKESGDIEYSTDVLIGLQFSGVGQKDFDVNEAKKQTPREVEAVILKNRNGATGDTLHYAYYSMFNKFLDMDDAEGGTEKLTTAPHTQVDDEGRVFNSEE